MSADGFFDLDADLVELAPYTPPLAETEPLREVRFHRKAWLPHEDAQLRALFAADEPLLAIATVIRHPWQGVRTRIWELGLRRNSTRPWTEAEDSEVVGRYGLVSPARIAQDLGRAVTAVYTRARILGLAQLQEPLWDGWDDAQLKAGYANGVPIPQIAALLGRTISAVYTRASRFNLAHPLSTPGWSEAECARALTLAYQGIEYLALIDQLVAEGFPRRTKAGLGAKLRKMGYGRGWGRAWTSDEDLLLRRAYADGASLTPLQAQLGRDRYSIHSRATVLKLHGSHAKPDGFRQGPVWTPAEDARLAAIYGAMSAKLVSKELGRALRAVYSRAFQLGLKDPSHRPWTAQDDLTIRIGWAHGLGQRELAVALDRGVPALSKHAKAMGVHFNDPDRPKASQERLSRRATITLAQILALGLPQPLETAA